MLQIDPESVNQAFFKSYLSRFTFENSIIEQQNSLMRTYYSTIDFKNSEIKNFSPTQISTFPIQSKVTFTNCSIYNITSNIPNIVLFENRLESVLTFDNCQIQNINMKIFQGSLASLVIKNTLIQNINVPSGNNFLSLSESTL